MFRNGRSGSRQDAGRLASGIFRGDAEGNRGGRVLRKRQYSINQRVVEGFGSESSQRTWNPSGRRTRNWHTFLERSPIRRNTFERSAFEATALSCCDL